MDPDVEVALSTIAGSQDAGPPGYPRLASFLREPEYMIFRRFRYVRMRVVLRQQFEIEQLERQLQKLDERDREDDPIALISQERDSNKDRERTLNLLKAALAEYDSLLQRNQWAMRAPEPTPDHVEILRKQVKLRLIKTERDFAERDVIDVGGATDPKFGRLYQWSEKLAMSSTNLWLKFGKRMRLIKSSGPVVVEGAVFRRVARTIATALSVLMLLLPMIVLNFVETSGWRLAVVSIFATFFIATLTTLSAVGTGEIFVAGATYCAVLVVFVSQGGATGGNGS